MVDPEDTSNLCTAADPQDHIDPEAQRIETVIVNSNEDNDHYKHTSKTIDKVVQVVKHKIYKLEKQNSFYTGIYSIRLAF
jgi:hypothetical protein